MKLAVVSDIHGNLDAFKKATADAEARGADKIVCLGDLCGGGPNSLECVDWAMKLRDEGKLEVCLLGNCDQASFFDAEMFGRDAENAVFWSRERVKETLEPLAAERWDFWNEAPRFYKKGDWLFVHGSPRCPLDEYVLADDVVDAEKMGKLFALTPRYAFLGHSHVPGVFVDEGGGKYSYFSPSQLDGGVFPLGERKLMINVGSVGQSRDDDARSCYVFVNHEENGADNEVAFIYL
ncbi:MAG: metallophosphoesterase [Thermoguttaceae bacterium]|nr:metallophosphoesterase [Thermoguttaceae bacterium]